MDFSNSDYVWQNLGGQSDYSFPAAGAGLSDIGYDYNYHPGGVAYSGPVPELNLPELIVPEHDGHEQQHVDDANGPCLHPWGSEWCPSHSPQAFHANMTNAAHSDYGATPGTGEDDPHMSSSGKKKRRSESLPPTIERYVQEPQRHEMIASGYETPALRRSKKVPTKKAFLSIVKKDMKGPDRRDRAGHR